MKKRIFALLLLASTAIAANKQIILLKTYGGPGGDTNLSYIFWLYPNPLAAVALSTATVSAWTGASGAENTAIQNGLTVERGFAGQVPSGASAAQIEAYLQAQYAIENTAFHNELNPNYVYGTFYDGTSWTLVVSTVTKK